MISFVAALLAWLLLPLTVHAQTTIDQLSTVPTPPATAPASTTQNFWMTQSGGDYKVSAAQAGVIFQGDCSTIATPYLHQLCWNTTQTPAILQTWGGSIWGPASLTGGVDIRQFGVVADGTDQRAKFQAAVNAMAGNGCLFIPQQSPGIAINTTTTPISLPTGTCIQGAGGGSRIFQLGGSNAMFAMAQNAVVRMMDLFIDGNRAAGATGPCIVTDPIIGVTGVELDRIAIMNCGGYALVLDGSTTPSNQVQIRDAFVTGNVGGIFANYLSNFEISSGLYRGNDSFGFACNTFCKRGQISGNTFSSNGCVIRSANIRSFSALNLDVTISNNVSQNSCGHGIHFGGQRISYVGNHVLDNANHGILTQSVNLYATGAATVANGSATVTGVGTSWLGFCPDIELGFTSEDGTRFASSATPANTVVGGGNAVGLPIKSIDSNTSLTLASPWTGTSQTLPDFTIWCPVSNIDNILIGNTIEGTGAGYAAIYMGRPQGGVVTGNTSDDASGAFGIVLTNAQGTTVGSNVMSNKTDTGILPAASSTYSTGTVSTTNGSSTVTLTGGSWDGAPNITFIRVGSDAVSYAVTSQTTTSLVLATPYLGSSGGGKSYVVQGGLSFGVAMSGNSTVHNGWGTQLQGCYSCGVTGGVSTTSTIGALTEINASHSNLITGYVGNVVSVIDSNSGAFHTNFAGVPPVPYQINNLPTTPGSLRAVCVNPANGNLYIASSGSTC